MFKPTPIQLSAELRTQVGKQLNTQTITRTTPKSLDPKNYPVFDIPVGKRVLIYVPNHVVESEDGVEELRMDKPHIHTLQEGKRFHYYRCIANLVLSDTNGNQIYDGVCPFCEGTSIPWDVANANIKHKCARAGLDAEDRENSQVKAIRVAEFSNRVIKEPTQYYTFPIVVISTANDDGKSVVKDEKGNPILTPMWYHISATQYSKKWEPTLEGIEDEPLHPGGRFFTLSYVYDTKGKEANKRDSAQNLNVIARNLKGSDKLKAICDKMTESWTPEKAQEVVVTNLLYSESDLKKIVDDALEGPKNMLSLLKASEETGMLDAGSDGFNLKAPTNEVKALDTVSKMDDTDADDDSDDLDLD